MAFLPTFSKTFRPVFDAGAAVAVPWWLSGGISAVNCVAAYQPKGASSLANSYINLANPGTYNATSRTAPDWDSTNGWKKTSKDNFLDTGIIPSSGWSMIARFSNNIVGTSRYIGSAIAGAYLLIAVTESETSISFYSGHQLNIELGARMVSGILAIAGDKGYINGVQQVGTAGAWTTTTNNTIYLLGTSGIGSGFWPYPFYQQAIAIYNTDISTKVAALTAAMKAL